MNVQRAVEHERVVRHRRRAAELEKDLLARLQWTPRELADHRTNALRALVRHACERSAFHRNRLAQIDVDRLSSDDLTSLPVMTKADLMRSFDEVVTDPRLRLADVEEHVDGLGSDVRYFRDEFTVVASAGSSGRRGVFIYGWDGFATLRAGRTRWRRAGEIVGGLGRVLGCAPPVAAQDPRPWANVAAEKVSHMTRLGDAMWGTPTGQHDIPATRPLREIVSRLNNLQPSGVMAYASVIVALAGEALAGALRITPSWLFGFSEPLPPEGAAAIYQAWGLRCPSAYGTSEGLLEEWCPHRRGHIPDDLVIVEPVDESGRPVARGSASEKILITNLYNLAQPLIRYEIPDRFTILDEKCSCGSVFPLVGPVEGRLDDVFTYAGGTRIHPHVFRSVLGSDHRIVEFQARQTDRGARVLVVGIPRDIEALRVRLADGMATQGLADPDVSIEVVPELERIGAGKLRRFVPTPSAG